MAFYINKVWFFTGMSIEKVLAIIAMRRGGREVVMTKLTRGCCAMMEDSAHETFAFYGEEIYGPVLAWKNERCHYCIFSPKKLLRAISLLLQFLWSSVTYAKQFAFFILVGDVTAQYFNPLQLCYCGLLFSAIRRIMQWTSVLLLLISLLCVQGMFVSKNTRIVFNLVLKGEYLKKLLLVGPDGSGLLNKYCTVPSSGITPLKEYSCYVNGEEVCSHSSSLICPSPVLYLISLR